MVQLVARDVNELLAKRKGARALGTNLPLTYEIEIVADKVILLSLFCNFPINKCNAC